MCVGYPNTQMGYKCYHPRPKRFFATRDVTFAENQSYFDVPSLQGGNLGGEENFYFGDFPDPNLPNQAPHQTLQQEEKTSPSE